MMKRRKLEKQEGKRKTKKEQERQREVRNGGENKLKGVFLYERSHF